MNNLTLGSIRNLRVLSSEWTHLSSFEETSWPQFSAVVTPPSERAFWQTNQHRFRTSGIFSSTNNDLEWVVDVLTEVVCAYKREVDYNGHYTAHLLGLVSEEEFEQIEMEFIDERPEIPQVELNRKVETLVSHTSGDFDPGDIVGLFNCSVSSASEALAFSKR